MVLKSVPPQKCFLNAYSKGFHRNGFGQTEQVKLLRLVADIGAARNKSAALWKHSRRYARKQTGDCIIRRRAFRSDRILYYSPQTRRRHGRHNPGDINSCNNAEYSQNAFVYSGVTSRNVLLSLFFSCGVMQIGFRNVTYRALPTKRYSPQAAGDVGRKFSHFGQRYPLPAPVARAFT